MFFSIICRFLPAHQCGKTCSKLFIRNIFIEWRTICYFNFSTYNQTQFSTPLRNCTNLIILSHQLRNHVLINKSCLHTSIHGLICDKLESDSSNRDVDIDDILEDEDYEFINRLYRVSGMGHNVFVIQPRVKWGPKKKLNTTSELQLAEAVALAETLPQWKVIERMVVPIKNPDKKHLFGSGNIAKLRSIVHNNPIISAVFVSQDILNPLQSMQLEKEFGVPVFDRYNIVLQIFRDHAHTKEAKLQVALAEVPYLRSKLIELGESGKNREGSGARYIGGSGETYLEIRRRLLLNREIKIKKALETLKQRRHLLRKNRLKMDFPVIAVVGYTNSGKTSLIKALTKDSNLEPKDQLFATLDVTVHAGLLPSNQKALYVDTVGFISDIPTTLIQSFASTLEDVAFADLIVHIRDISHPDAEAQKDNVIQTLGSLNLPEKLQTSMIEVGNKVDLVDSSRLEAYKGSFLVSATEEIGLDILREEIETKIIENTGYLTQVFRVPSGGEEYRWLYKEAAVKNITVDNEDTNFLFLEVLIQPSVNAKFAHKFRKTGALSECRRE